MRFALTINRIYIRSLGYLMLIILPSLTLMGAWLLLESSSNRVSPLVFIGGAQLLVSLCYIMLWIIRPTAHLSSEQEQALFESQELFSSLYKRSPVPYITIDSEGRVVMYNLAAVRLFQTTTDELVGERLAPHITLDDENELAVVHGKLESEFPVSEQEVQVVTVTGETRWVLLSVFAHEATRQRLVSLVDITHQKQIDRAKSEFVALATHQLRTPVAAIRWNVELLERKLGDTKTPEQSDYLEKIERNIMRMIALINDFLSVSKLETGTFATTLKPLDLTEFFTSVQDEFLQTLKDKNLQVYTSHTPEHLSYNTDERLFHIIVSNLFSNAVKYVQQDGSISFNYQLDGETLRITVADNGIGIPSDEQHKLFSKFFRARNAQSHRAEGTGLGLYIVKQSVEKLGGTIAVTSAEGQGTRFDVALPFSQD